jgi:eukaryotic-like serine/threonine-protein kinase
MIPSRNPFPPGLPMRHDDPTQTAQPPTSDEPSAPAPAPPHIGKYRVEKLLGQGSFGLVYLAFDAVLDRYVAIKVPHRRLVARPEDAEPYLAEARTVARLDHANIVPVYESGHSDDWPLYVVSKYVAGSTLARRVADGPVPVLDAAGLVATVAEALHHAHQHRVVHRDVKPGNILLDSDGKPYVTDFGLALRADNVGRGPAFAGTPAYMSPEQARREGHRVDGRTDVFSLGVVFYELLTGGRPFRGTTQSELLEQIQTHDPVPPRQLADGIPAELERICLKALAKRAADRYSTARDLADDLRHFLKEFVGAETLPIVPRARRSPEVAPPTPASDREAVKVVPKGLRSFDAHDTDFFLGLLPGPRDRDGLPESIRSWKTRIEDPDDPFAVGLIYGPSGCGKSSLVKAGLLPRLSDRAAVVYVEATAAGTEARLLSRLRKRLPGLAAEATLSEAMAALRGDLAGSGKVLIVLDQFEQWLHVHPEPHSELVRALRHCDGGRVQCLVLVRDDFWLPVSRFMNELEVDLVPNRNIALVDLFDPGHARKVLTAFGRAYERLPEKTRDLSREQTEFLDQAAAGLTQDGKIICVRLAVFADMMKGRPWTPAGLAEVGGTQGIGVSFLEDTFSSPAANPRHRRHQAAARAVLRALLPDAGDDIKGNMRSETELRAASGYGPAEFADLIRALDGDVRLITPTDPEGAARPGQPAGEKFYQLTHDYLVRPLRDWLTRKRRETRRGRAELRLEERAAEWARTPGRRQLPSLTEWAGIRLQTRRRSWTPPQGRMMRAADVYYLGRCLAIVLVVCLVGLGLGEWSARLRTQSYHTELLTASPAELPAVLKKIEPYRGRLEPHVRASLATETAPDRRHRAAIFLLGSDAGQVTYLYKELLQAEVQEFPLLRDSLVPFKSDVLADLWRANDSADPDSRFRAACALATFDPEDARWPTMAAEVVEGLLAQPSLTLNAWTAVLLPARGHLVRALVDRLEDDPPDADGRRNLIALVRAFTGPDAGRLGSLEARLTALQNGGDPERAKSVASLAAALLALGTGEPVWPLLRHRPDPTVRSYLIERLAASGVDPADLVRRFRRESDVSARRALVLALGCYPPNRVEGSAPDLEAWYETDPDAGIHAAAGWALLRIRGRGPGPRLPRHSGPVPGREWYVNEVGLTFSVLSRPFRLPKERALRVPSLPVLAVGTTEVTEAQFREFKLDRKTKGRVPPATDLPVSDVNWFDAAAYCNWLSWKANLPGDQWCYTLIDGRLQPVPGYQRLTGYRLPTAGEWEYVCQAGASTPWHFGRADAELMNRHGWWQGNAHENGERRPFPVGRLKPNDWGLFDMHGNMSEWCHESNRPPSKQFLGGDSVHFGGGFAHPYAALAHSKFAILGLTQSLSTVGFRVVRSLPGPSPKGDR